MGERENELVNDAIRAHRSANQLQGCVVGVVEDEVVKIEVAQARTSNASGQLFAVQYSRCLVGWMRCQRTVGM